MFDLQGKVALVTGASRGLGADIARLAAERGWDVAINYHHDRTGAEAMGEMLAQCGVRHWIFQADVGDEQWVSDRSWKVRAHSAYALDSGEWRLLADASGNDAIAVAPFDALKLELSNLWS